MKLVWQEKEITLLECKSFFSRFRGFMFKKKIDQALMFDHCNSIHTFFMRTAIDVLLCDKNNKVLYCYKNLGRNKVILPKKGVKIVYELPVGYFNVQVNDRLEIKR